MAVVIFPGCCMYVIYARNAQSVCSFSFCQSIFMLLFKYFQIDEVKNIGSLPCLEKVMLSSNPLSIIPDYRTKVLAQFGDRASEVSPVLLFSPSLQPAKGSGANALKT